MQQMSWHRVHKLKLKKVLFIAYDFPPCKSVGASLRSEYFVQYLGEFGWHPTVVCLGPALGAERYPDVNRVPSATPWHKPYEVTPYGWSIPLLNCARDILAADHFDLLYASCPPFAHTSTLLRLKKQFGLPLVLDFRDAWSLDPYVEGSRLKKLLYKRVFPRLERKIFSHADRVLFNTPSALAGYKQLYPDLETRFALLPNGYNKQDFPNTEPLHQQQEGPLKVVHLGRFGIGGRKPGIILDALRVLRNEGTHVLFTSVGEPVGNMDLQGAAHDLPEIVQILPNVPHAEALAQLRNSDIALLYQEGSPSKVTAVAGKTHEYLRSGKPILAIAPPGDNLDLIRAMAGFYRIVPQPATPRAVANELRQLVALKALGQLPACAAPAAKYIKEYSRRALTAALVEQFKAVLAD